MKRIFMFAITVLMAIFTVFAVSCTKESSAGIDKDNNIPSGVDSCNCVVISFGDISDESEGTKSGATNIDARSKSDWGCSAALYKKTGERVAVSQCGEGERNVYFYITPTEDYYVYGISNPNGTVNWPSNLNQFDTFTGGIEIMDSSRGIPCATDLLTTGKSKYELPKNQRFLNVVATPLFGRVFINNNIEGDSWVMTGAEISKCPKVVKYFNPGGITEGGDMQSGNDYMTSSDLELFYDSTEKKSFVYVPCGVTSDVTAVGYTSRKDGQNETDTYTFTVVDVPKGGKQNVSINESGSSASKKTVELEDTRRVIHDVSELTVDKVSGSSFGTKGYAANGGTDWTYYIEWSGNSDLEGSNTILHYGLDDEWDLSEDGYIEGIKGDGVFEYFYITSDYEDVINEEDAEITVYSYTSDGVLQSSTNIIIPYDVAPYITPDKDKLTFTWRGTYDYIWPTYNGSVDYSQYKSLKERTNDAYEVLVTTNCSSWSVQSSPSWCSVTKNGNALDITVHGVFNPFGSNLTGNIVLVGQNTSGQQVTKTIQVTQKVPESWMKFTTTPFADYRSTSTYPSTSNLSFSFYINTSKNISAFQVVSIIGVKANSPTVKDFSMNDTDLIASIDNQISITSAGSSGESTVPYKYKVSVTIPKATLQTLRNIGGANGCVLYFDFDDVSNSLYSVSTQVEEDATGGGFSPIILEYPIDNGRPRYTVRIY